ncbi:hypothetical protein IC801_15260 [Geobacillus sp. 44B]|jgi:hypothetical protein|nr:hypothetical protein IC801_15260 [Geobacillus sp. 44B]
MRKKWILLLSVFCLMTSLFAGCGNDDGKEEKRNQSSNMGGGMNTSGTGR